MKRRRWPCVRKNVVEGCSVGLLAGMRPCHPSQHRGGLRENGRLVFLLFHHYIASCKINSIIGVTRETISDLNSSLTSRYPISVENERTSLTSCVSVLKSTRLVISLKSASDKKVTSSCLSNFLRWRNFIYQRLS